MRSASTAPPAGEVPAPWVREEYRAELKSAALAVAACVAVLLVFVLVPATQFALPADVNVALHTLLETVSIVVSVLVFSVGWHTISHERSSNVALACSVFLAVAVLDFVHVLSFEGMPAFVTPSGEGKAIVFFLAARFLAAGALLAMALLPWDRPIPPLWRYWLPAFCLGFALAVAALGLLLPDLRRLFLVPGSGLTALKIGLEYAIVLLNMGAAAGFLMRMRAIQPFPVVDLFAAAAIAAVSELSFTLYARTVDQYSIVGHAYKVMAYLLVYRALFVTLVRMPYLHLQAARDEILRLNASLEQRVRERTAELEAANQELEQFSQSVAHDLRSPLGAVSAFSRALEAALPPTLDPKPRHMLERIRASVDRMEQMIQALLELAHVSRSTLQRERLDVSAIARQVLGAHRDAQPDRAVEAAVQDGIVMEGDRTLVTLVLQNLIGNAWKFTGTTAQPRITVGVETVEGQTVCFVRDNGAGFDMAYAGKLFGVFQRLHTAAEFPGHGIGLANVRRIVMRHGGRVWAESAPGQGAVFRFTLGPPPA